MPYVYSYSYSCLPFKSLHATTYYNHGISFMNTRGSMSMSLWGGIKTAAGSKPVPTFNIFYKHFDSDVNNRSEYASSFLSYEL